MVKWAGHYAMEHVSISFPERHWILLLIIWSPDWFFAIGYGFIMGSLLVKTYRVDRIFRNSKSGFTLPDLQLGLYVGFITLVEVTILLLMQFHLENPSWERTITIPVTNYSVTQAACPVSAPVGPTLLYVWNAIIIFFAAVYAFRTRNVMSGIYCRRHARLPCLILGLSSLQ